MAKITVKEFDMIGEQLTYEKMMVSKYKACYRYCNDPQLQMQCQRIAAKHEDNFIRLLNLLS